MEGRISAYSKYKFFLIRNDKSSGGVQILLAEDVLEVKCIPDRICLIKTNTERCLDDGFNNATYNELLCTMATTGESETFYIVGTSMPTMKNNARLAMWKTCKGPLLKLVLLFCAGLQMTSLLIRRFFSIRRRAISIYLKEKRGATDTGNYWDLKLTDHCMKVIKECWRRCYKIQWTYMYVGCTLNVFLEEEQLMQFSLCDSFKTNTVLRRGTYTLPLLK